MNKWKVYIIQAESGKLYTGITSDLERRFQAHLKGKAGARFFRLSPPHSIVYSEECLNRSEASKRESGIKKLTRHQKLSLIQSQAT